MALALTGVLIVAGNAVEVALTTVLEGTNVGEGVLVAV